MSGTIDPDEPHEPPKPKRARIGTLHITDPRDVQSDRRPAEGSAPSILTKDAEAKSIKPLATEELDAALEAASGKDPEPE